MVVRAKVVCDGVEQNKVYFHTVCETDAEKSSENVRFTKYTPNGKIELEIDNPMALEQFVAGKSYYVDFTEAPA